MDDACFSSLLHYVIPTSPCCNFCTILDLLSQTPGIWPEQVLNPSFRTFSKAESSPSTREPRCRGRCDRISFLMNWFQQRLGPRHSRCPHVLMFTLTRASLRLRNRSLLWEPPSNFSLRMRTRPLLHLTAARDIGVTPFIQAKYVHTCVPKIYPTNIRGPGREHGEVGITSFVNKEIISNF